MSPKKRWRKRKPKEASCRASLTGTRSWERSVLASIIFATESVNVFAPGHTNTHARIHTYAHTHTHTHIRIRIHAHTHLLSQQVVIWLHHLFPLPLQSAGRLKLRIQFLPFYQPGFDDEDEEDASVALPTRRLVTHNVPDGLKVCHSFPLTSLFPKTIYCTRAFNVNLVACFDHCIILWLCCISIEAWDVTGQITTAD